MWATLQTGTENGGDRSSCHDGTNNAGVGVLFSSRFIPSSYTVEEVVKGGCYELSVDSSTWCSTNKLNTCNSEVFLFVGGDFNCTQDDRGTDSIRGLACEITLFCWLG